VQHFKGYDLGYNVDVPRKNMSSDFVPEAKRALEIQLCSCCKRTKGTTLKGFRNKVECCPISLRRRNGKAAPIKRYTCADLNSLEPIVGE
jgi:hypothetical protein